MAKLRFDNKIIMVTGAAGAIGAAAVRRFIEEGGKVAIVDMAADKAQALAAEVGSHARAFVADVGQPEEVNTVVDDVVVHFGSLDILFNNAGISGKVAPLHEWSIDDWQHIINSNLNSMFYVLRATLRVMIDRRIQGSIVNMGSSIAGWDVLAGGVGYSASKYGVVGISRIAALDAAPYGIRVNAICPGVIDTNLGIPATDGATFRDAQRRFADRIPLRRLGQPEDVAALVAFLSSDEARHITGVDWLIDGGQTLQSWSNAPETAQFPRFIVSAREKDRGHIKSV